MSEQMLSGKVATKPQDRMSDGKVAQNRASMLSRATEVVVLTEAASSQSTRNRALWKQNRATRKQRLAAKRVLLPVSQIPGAAVKVYPLKNKRGGYQTAKVCSICGEPRKGTHGKLLTDCPHKSRTVQRLP